MVSIISIFFGFILLMVAELRSARTKRPVSAALQVPGYALIAMGMLCAPLGGEQPLQVPEGVRMVCLGLAIAGGGLLVWTVFLEIPLGVKRYKVAAGHVYAHGSYGRCRHPGFWCFLLFSVGFGLWSNNFLVLIGFLTANALNLLLILLQDQYTFPTQFVDYREYAKKVPFLVPRFKKQRR